MSFILSHDEYSKIIEVIRTSKVLDFLINSENPRRLWTLTKWEVIESPFHYCDVFLRLHVRSTTKFMELYTNPSSSDGPDTFENEIELDDLSVTASNYCIYGFLDICKSPTFQVLCPYMKIWNQQGSIISVDDLQRCLDISNPCKYDGSEFGRLVIDDHAVENCYSITAHLCELTNMVSGESRSLNYGLQFLSWLSVVGPYIGFNISSSEFMTLKGLFIDS